MIECYSQEDETKKNHVMASKNKFLTFIFIQFLSSPCFVESLKEHIDYDHNNIRYICQYCQLQFRSQQVAQRHVARKHTNQMRSCTHCDYKTYKPELYDKHMRLEHGVAGMFIILLRLQFLEPCICRPLTLRQLKAPRSP